MSLYRSVLGEDFGDLAPVLQRFHGAAAGSRARGILRVERGRGPLARFACLCMGAPAPGDAVPVDMIVEVDPSGRERWVRSFAGSPMVTRQWRRGDRLVEALGPCALAFELEREGTAMVFRQRACRMLGIPWPLALAPVIEARVDQVAVGDDATWEVDVTIALPLIGRVLAYAGTMRVED